MNFLKIGPGLALYDYFKPLRIESQLSTKERRLLVSGFISHDSTSNEISGVQNSIRCTTAPAYLARRNTKVGKHGSTIVYNL